MLTNQRPLLYNQRPPWHFEAGQTVEKTNEFRQFDKSFRPPFSKGGAVEGAEPSSPSADGEILLSALSFCKAFSLRLHGQRKSVVQIRSFLWLTPFVYSLNSCLSLDDRQDFLYFCISFRIKGKRASGFNRVV